MYRSANGAARPLTARQAERRRAILASARALVAEHGYDAVSMRAIAAASGAAEKTLFNIFGSKDRLLAAAAFERSASVFDLAEARGAPGWPRLLALCAAVAEVTLAAPAMARALAVPLIDHIEMVGLDRLYDAHVGAALGAMVAEGFLAPATPVPLVAHLVQLAVVSGVVFWAKGELEDDECAPFLRLRLAETLLPHATGGLAAVRAEHGAALALLGRRVGT